MVYTKDDFFKAVKHHMEYAGLVNLEIDEHIGMDFKIGLYWTKTLDHRNLRDNMKKSLDEVCGELFQDIYKSQLVLDIESKHGREVESLSERIKELEIENNKLSGVVEYLECNK